MAESKILIISWSLPPEPIAMATVVENIAKQFSKDQIVMAGEKNLAVNYKTRESINDIEIAFITIKLGSRKIFSLLQLPFALIKIFYLIRKHRIKNIFTIYPTEVFLLIGYLASIFSGKTLYIYYVNSYIENKHSLLKPIHIFFQKAVFQRAKHVFVMSEAMVHLFKKNYPDLNKCSALVHTFNEKIPEYENYEIGNQINFYFSGNVNASCEEAAKRLFNTITSISEYNITISPAIQKQRIEKIGINISQIRFISVSRNDLVKEINKADIVLLPHGFHGVLSQDEYDTIFPTKTIEYLICGRPILFHGPPESFITRFMIQNNCAYVVDEPNEKKILEGIIKLKENPLLRKDIVNNAFKAATMFYAPDVIEKFKKIILSG
jgi:hypothetical protein